MTTQAMNPKSTSLRTTLGAVLLTSGLFLSASVASAADNTLYAQGFANNSSASQTASDYGWSVYRNGDSIEGVTATFKIINSSAGADAIENVNALKPYGDNILAGMMAMANNVGDTVAFATLDAPISRAAYESLSFGMQTKGPAAAEFRFVLKIGDTVYVSEQTFTPSSTSTWGSVSLELTDASRWAEVTGLTGESFSIAGTSSELSALTGNITGVGLYSKMGGSSSRYADNFVVTGTPIPEPSTCALTAGIAVILGCMIFRRRNAARHFE
ncbi:hypothetical protein OpiT1DRAFT_04965 [Opitutaceae bacterium TAV1]|nr:hypothetical protein OpiT1DRAFT_04965 [Opitutaceae bacterium TAV1]